MADKDGSGKMPNPKWYSWTPESKAIGKIDGEKYKRLKRQEEIKEEIVVCHRCLSEVERRKTKPIKKLRLK